MKVYTVYTNGPTIGGRVALFSSRELAKKFCKYMNKKRMFSKKSEKDNRGISLAWLMGDGMYYFKEEEVNLEKDVFIFD